MQPSLPKAPAERLIDSEGGDILAPLRRICNQYIDDGNLAAASRVANLMGDTAVADEIIIGDVSIGEYADFDPAQGAAIDHSIATGEPLFSKSDIEEIRQLALAPHPNEDPNYGTACAQENTDGTEKV